MADPGTIDVAASAARDGRRVEVTLRLDIPEGTHIEAHEPPEPFLVPTEVELVDLDVTRATYPPPVEKDLGLPGPPLLVYEGSVSVTVEARAEDGATAVRGAIRYQPCVGGACLPPREQAWQAAIEPASRSRPRGGDAGEST